MRVVLQRVSRAKITVDSEIIGQIGVGLLCFAGFNATDDETSLRAMAQKIVNLRIFEDANEKMNLSLIDLNASILVVSQFTLYADCRKGRRPSFIEAAPPATAQKLYENFVTIMRSLVPKVETGQFQAMMDVELVNDGPVTIIIDSDDLPKTS